MAIFCGELMKLTAIGCLREMSFQGRPTFHPFSGQKSIVRLTTPQAFSQGPDLSFHVVVSRVWANCVRQGGHNSASWKNLNCHIGNAGLKETLSFTVGQDPEPLCLPMRSNQKPHNCSWTFLISVSIYCNPCVIRQKMYFSCGHVLRLHCSKPLNIRILGRNCAKLQSLTVLVEAAII